MVRQGLVSNEHLVALAIDCGSSHVYAATEHLSLLNRDMEAQDGDPRMS